ncbi:hypothetical protein MUN86_08895 [Hymenobacter volaticus]|uniref:Mannosylglycerate hydrolase MGH1-like glycoside hydrolase domain-containing protein n=1 Tax=Hymenobacter volaticus TaxID=2932254 RepID=A0ABY4GBK2_9BACT|nr:trehalase family glycosidase [Hymenobacter volaticus]UOQ67954.1 hypothetical protein MUN86_08895 [Hymenobacter volaticus]
MRLQTKALLFFLGFLNWQAPNAAVAQQRPPFVLTTDKLRSSVAWFNSMDQETVVNHVPNAQAADWLAEQVPLFECPDSLLQQTYYYRWWTYRKHLKQTPDGYVFTEFITPMNHAGKHNTISSALGHHLNEGRWLHDSQYIDQYLRFWLFADPKQPKPKLRAFSSWLQDAVYSMYLVNPNKALVQELLPVLHTDYRQWEKEKMLPNGMFWQFDVRDAMEESISGSRKEKNVRPTINSYMYGNAKAMSAMAKLVKNDTLQTRYAQKAKQLRADVQRTLWDEKGTFFKVQYEKGASAKPARSSATFRGTSRCPPTNPPTPSSGPTSPTRPASGRRGASPRPSGAPPASAPTARATAASGTARCGPTPPPKP